MKDLVNAVFMQTEPKYEENRRTIMEAHAFIERAKQERAAQAAPPSAKGRAPGNGEGKGPRSQPPDKVSACKYALSIGIAQEIFEDWWQYGESTSWTATDGKIRSWHAALRGYAKKIESKTKEESWPV
jgi:hypothetical protein